MSTLDGKVAIVTGASRGIGRGCANVLAEAGATVYLTGRSVTEDDHPLPGTVGATAAEIVAAGGRAVGVVCDHRDDAAVEALFDQVQEEAGRLDVLVNNAFIVCDELTSGKPFWEVPISNWDDMIDVGTRSAYVASVHAYDVAEALRTLGYTGEWSLAQMARTARHKATTAAVAALKAPLRAVDAAVDRLFAPREEGEREREAGGAV